MIAAIITKLKTIAYIVTHGFSTGSAPAAGGIPLVICTIDASAFKVATIDAAAKVIATVEVPTVLP